MGALIKIFGFLINAIVLIFYVGAVVDLTIYYLGAIGYWVWPFPAMVLVELVLILPWFDAWVAGGGLDPVITLIWIVWLAWLGVSVLWVWISARKASGPPTPSTH